jgi:flagellar basal-body rod protein FlgB
MYHKIGNKNFTLLSRMLDLHATRGRVIAANIANVNTPNYHRRTFEFESALRDAMSKGTSGAYNGIRGWISRPNNTPVRNNGNNVDVEQEMVALKENATAFEVYSTLYSQKSQMVHAAIRGQMQ